MLDWIRRSPAKFSAFVLAAFAVALDAGRLYGLDPGIATGLNVTLALGLGWFVEAVSVPTVKLSDAQIAKVSAMTPADIAVVAATKAEAKGEVKP